MPVAINLQPTYHDGLLKSSRGEGGDWVLMYLKYNSQSIINMDVWTDAKTWRVKINILSECVSVSKKLIKVSCDFVEW